MRLMAGRSDTAGDNPSDRGNAIIAAVGFGLLALLALGNVVGGIVAEHRAVEDSLAQTRMYWAAMGHVTYLLSRTGGAGLCPAQKDVKCDSPSTVATHSSAMLAEIQDLQVWQYPELGSTYRFRVQPSVTADPRAKSGEKGRLLFQAQFQPAGGATTQTLQALRTVPTTRPVELRYCLTKNLGENPCSGDNNDAKVTWIVNVHRPARP